MIREAAEKNPNEWVYVENLRVGDILVYPQPAEKDPDPEYDDGATLALMGDGEWESLSLKDYCDCVRETLVVGITLMYVGERLVSEDGHEQDWEGHVLRIEVKPLIPWDEVTNHEACELGWPRSGFYWYVLPRYEGEEQGEMLKVRGSRRFHV